MSDKQIKRIVVDASIAMKWVKPSEEFADTAERMLQAYESGRISFAVPSFFYYEAASGISKAVARGSITKEEGLEALNGLLDMEMENYSLPDVRNVYFLSQAYGRSIYDCFYLALAQKLGVEFWTADKKLYDATESKLQFVRWIGDYTR